MKDVPSEKEAFTFRSEAGGMDAAAGSAELSGQEDIRYRERLAAEIQKGRDDFEAGRIARPEDVQAVFDAYRPA